MKDDSGMTELPGVLTKENIVELIKGDPPLISGAVNLDEQLQPNGFDLTLKSISSFGSKGVLTADNAGRELSQTPLLKFDESGGVDLNPGAYLVMFNEIVNMPANIMALARPRSSLNRCGISIHSAVWDAGYSGRSQSLLVVYNSLGYRLHRDARIAQLIFFYLCQDVVTGYSGKYQHENKKPE